MLGLFTLLTLSSGRCARADDSAGSTAKMLSDYYHAMSAPKPFVIRRGEALKAHQENLRRKVLASASLWPLPKRVPLDVHVSAPLDHPWCTVKRVRYQLWSGVYTNGLLFLPKKLAERPASAMLCPHGHWQDGNAHADVQKRCLNFARLGYVTFSPTQEHYEDLMLGVSNQTLMIWENMRALDYLESLEQVDKSRIGVAGASGGGLQAQMMIGLDDRIRAASIVGLTCDFREIMFPASQHCDCNHFPRVMQATDHPEISTLGMPSALQFLTMNDWTKSFQSNNFPVIKRLYTVNGYADRVDCQYFDTPHSYDKPKREATYGWMERWVRGGDSANSIAEPDEIETFAVDVLKGLTVDVPEDRGLGHIRKVFTEQHGYKVPTLASAAEWQAYRRQLREDLKHLLGVQAVLPRAHNASVKRGNETAGKLIVERVGYPSEGGLLVPTIVIRRQDANGKLSVVMVLSEAGGESLLKQTGAGSPRRLALDGNLVVLPDVRVYGQMLSTGSDNNRQQRRAWQRNGVVWGRPVAGMACTDIQGVLDGIAARDDADMGRVTLESRESGSLAVVSLFAAALDTRITSVDADLGGRCFGKRNLPLVSGVLRYGDVLQWAALLADRQLSLRNVPSAAGDPQWLRDAFTATDNAEGLRITSQ